MKTTEKRDNQFIVNLTTKEAEKLRALSERARRKPAELLYLLVSEIIEELKPDNVNTGVIIEDLR